MEILKPAGLLAVFYFFDVKVLFTIADLQPESGGPSRSVSALTAAVVEWGIEVELVALEYGSGGTAPLIPPEPVQTTLVHCRGVLARKSKRSPKFEAVLRKSCDGKKPVLLHDNGLWLPTNHAAAQVAREMQIPFLISPRGMLTPWAMRFHGMKKRVAWLLYQRRDLQSARVLHATSRQEAEEFRALGLKQPVAVIPNGVALPPPNCEFRTPNSELRTVLFLSRIHPVKGLLDLVEAWASVQQSAVGGRWSVVGGQPKWRVVVAGGDENGHLAVVKAEIRKKKLENSFEFIGEVPDEKKWGLYQSADLFVLPTQSENFGIVIAEALACGLPVITTRGTPWEELPQRRCGWWVELGAGPLAEALNEAVRLPDEERRAMGLRGRKLIEENYTWSAAARKMVAVYQWMLEGAAKPEWVV